MAVVVHFRPERAFELAAYTSIVANLARDGRGRAWAQYDRTFRQAAAVNPQLPWSRREQDIWLTAALDASSIPAVCPPASHGTPSAHRSSEVCRNWNSGGSTYTACHYRHVCSLCQESGHTNRECTQGRSSQWPHWSSARSMEKF